jgi:steroid delta-isomerase-like uncharacterized protein
MSTEENQRICDALFPLAWNEGDFSLVDKHVSPEVVDHFDNSKGIDAFKGVIGMFRGAFPDLRLTIEDSLADGDKVVHRWTMTGTNQGELMGIPPSGKQMRWTGITIVRLENEQIVERWANVDILAILQQMGVVPPPPGAP